MNEGKLHEDKAKGERAATLLDSDVYQEVMDTLKQRFYQEWCASHADDAVNRERLWLMLKLTEKIEDQIKSIVNTGKLANSKLLEIEENE